MNAADVVPCFNGPEILLEQFIPDHVFFYLLKGSISCYDGHKSYTFEAGEYCLVRKNRLASYHINKESGFERRMFCFEEEFLRRFQQKHKLVSGAVIAPDTFITVTSTMMIPEFIRSLNPYCDSAGKIEAAFEELKYEELLIILLKIQPELAGVLFDYARPEKINLEEFMNRNFTFNVPLERFAYLTGRSLSAFKRDFKTIFHITPSHWLVQRRLQEAYFLINKKHKKASEIYLNLGFEDLSHFSFAFKKLFGHRPTELKK